MNNNAPFKIKFHKPVKSSRSSFVATPVLRRYGVAFGISVAAGILSIILVY